MASKPVYLMYLNSWNNFVPDPSLVSEITHLCLAFMSPAAFNQPDPALASFPFFTSIEAMRSKFAKNTKVMIAIGGWGDTEGFSIGAKSKETRKLFARNVKAMLDITGADGVDIDWEYPGGNGEDWKKTSNSEKVWEIDAYPELIYEIRSAIGTDKIMSAAIPGLPRDMIAFSSTNITKLVPLMDFFNIMTYDLMNRRDSTTQHHAGIEPSLEAVNTYLDRGIPAHKANLGFAFYVKWFKIASIEPGFSSSPIGIPTVLMEDPITGEDLGTSGAFAWCDEVPVSVKASFGRAMEQGQYDEIRKGHYFLDQEEGIFWSWETPEAIESKFDLIMKEKGLGGVFAWGLGEDSRDWRHLKALNDKVEEAK